MTICRFRLAIAVFSGMAMYASAAMAAAPNTAPGKACFDKYVKLEAAFSPKAYAMYADEALIEVTFMQPNGGQKVQQISAAKFKADIIQALPDMKKKKDADLYKNVHIAAEGSKYWVTATDYSVLRGTEAAMSMRIYPDTHGNCIIDALELVYKVAKK